MGMAVGGRGKGRVLFALLLCGGCGVPGTTETPASTASETAAIKYRCPDPTTDCTMSNGTGVYTAEDGQAYIDDTLQAMITSFHNTGSAVTFQARYYEASSQRWLMLPAPGTIRWADYAGATNLQVHSVTETATVPTWVLEDANGAAIDVTGKELVNLQLHLDFADPDTGKLRMYVIGFNPVQYETGAHWLYKYPMYWRLDGNPATTNQPYCYDENGKVDPVVFQRGIAVNPTTAVVTRDATTADTVTLSCRLGGIATVYWWGYPYLTGSIYFYAAGLQMKRASYCADSNHYTIAGTHIRIDDSAGIQSDPIDDVEAYWTPAGATCIGLRRHPEIPFSGKCNGVALPSCPTIAARQAEGGVWLADGVD
ncbi:MAG TPA: ADYC domain-containing protein [Polyangia bacterium]|nr:ADYC domain-containing protein [Polyangia bacterium]